MIALPALPALPIGTRLTVSTDPAAWLDAIREAEGVDVEHEPANPGRWTPSVEVLQARPEVHALVTHRQQLTLAALWERIAQQDELLAELRARLDGDGCTRVSYEQFKADVSARGA